jgi:hypothetical protein
MFPENKLEASLEDIIARWGILGLDCPGERDCLRQMVWCTKLGNSVPCNAGFDFLFGIDRQVLRCYGCDADG